MRYVTAIFLLCLVWANSSIAEDEISREIRILAGDKPVDIGGYRGAAPFFGDFDGDGLKDLLVGQDTLGRLRIYQNVGTDKEPRFNNFEWFRVNGEIAELPGHGLFRPQLVDLNGDGKLDIVSASESGMIFWYRRNNKGEFGDPEILKLASGQVLNVGSDASCHVADWDGDGDNDLIVAGRLKYEADSNSLQFVENTGSPQLLSLAAPKVIEADGQPIQAPRPAVFPFVGDLNRDGKHDLLLGLGNGTVLLYENVGEQHAPKLAKAVHLIESPVRGGQPPKNDSLTRGMGGSICVTDCDGDGKLDILIGDAQQETVEPEASDTSDQIEAARQEIAQTLGAYRRLRRLNSRLRESQEKQKEMVHQERERHAQRLEELSEKISKLETAMEPHQVLHSYIWMLRLRQPQ